MNTVEKQANPIVINDQGEPIALVFFNHNRERIIYTLIKADEEDLVRLLSMDVAGKTLKSDEIIS